MWYLLLFSFLFGVGAFYLDLNFFPLIIILAVFLFGIFYFFKNLISGKKYFYIFLIILLFFGGFFRSQFFKPELFSLDPLDKLLGEETEFYVSVLDSPARKEFSLRAKGSLEIKDSPNVLLVFDRDAEVNFADKLLVEGSLKKPENFETEQGREFDYVGYLKKDGIKYILEVDEYEKIGEESWPIRKSLFNFAEKLKTEISNFLPEPKASLLNAILLGDRDGIPGNIRDSFIRTGTIHIMALSGYNISVILDSVLRFGEITFGIKYSFIPAILASILFAIMVGGGASVVRATIMALTVLIAKRVGRTYDALRALSVAVFVMVLINPTILIFDLSFQLSALATLGLILIPERIEKYFKIIKKKFLRETVVATISAQIAVTPLLLIKTGSFSIISLPANVLIVPVLPIVMFLGGVIILFSILPIVSFIPAFFANLLLSYLLFVVDILGNISFASVRTNLLINIILISFNLLIIYRIFKNKRV